MFISSFLEAHQFHVNSKKNDCLFIISRGWVQIHATCMCPCDMYVSNWLGYVDCFKNLMCQNITPFLLKYDNQASIYIASNPVFHEWTKHIELDFHYVREQVQVILIDLTHFQHTSNAHISLPIIFKVWNTLMLYTSLVFVYTYKLEREGGVGGGGVWATSYSSLQCQLEVSYIRGYFSNLPNRLVRSVILLLLCIYMLLILFHFI